MYGEPQELQKEEKNLSALQAEGPYWGEGHVWVVGPTTLYKLEDSIGILRSPLN